jgi:hypothetical protein
MNQSLPPSAFQHYRPWFYAAALYNLGWGCLVILRPNLLFDLYGLPRPTDTALWQVVGMFVLVYAPAYWWAARRPDRHHHLVLIGFIGKLLGPMGFVWSVLDGRLPLAFFWIILTNDLIWWPAFALYLRDVSKRTGGFLALIRG